MKEPNSKSTLPDILAWSEIHSFIILGAALLSFWQNSPLVLIFAALISFAYYLASHKAFLSQYKPFGGYANMVTLTRLLLICFASLFWSTWPDFVLFACFTSAIIMDVFDGYLARKFHQSSDFGLYFDMETDAFFVALISFVLWQKGFLESWLLFPAFLRYLYMLLLKVSPFKPKKEPKRRYASIIAGTYFVMLLLPFILPYEVYIWPLRISGFSIIASFTVSFWYQFLRPDAVNEGVDKTKIPVHKNNP